MDVKRTVSMARTRTFASQGAFGRTLTGVSMARTKTCTSQASLSRALTSCSLASLDEDLDFLLDASIDTVREIVLDPPDADLYDVIQPEMVLLDKTHGSAKRRKGDEKKPGAVLLHVYDLNENFRKANELLTFSFDNVVVGGAFHVGVEIFGTEWFYGTVGITSTLPRVAAGHVYNSTVFLGVADCDELGFADVLYSLCEDWQGSGYQLISRNCCSFATELCSRLGTQPLPSWVSRVPYILDTGRRVSMDAMDKLREMQSNMSSLTDAIVQKTSSQKPAKCASYREGSPDFCGPRAPKKSLPKHPGDDVGEPVPDDVASDSTSTTSATSPKPVLLGRGQFGQQLPMAGQSSPDKRGRSTSSVSVDFSKTRVVPFARSPSPPYLASRATSPVVRVNGHSQKPSCLSTGFRFIARSVSPPPSRVVDGECAQSPRNIVVSPRSSSPRPASPPPTSPRREIVASPPVPIRTSPSVWSWPFAAAASEYIARSPSPCRVVTRQRAHTMPQPTASNHFVWAATEDA